MWARPGDVSVSSTLRGRLRVPLSPARRTGGGAEQVTLPALGVKVHSGALARTRSVECRARPGMSGCVGLW